MKTTTKNKLTGGVHDESIWTPYAVTLNFVGRLCASTPADANVIGSWLESRKPSHRPPSGKTIQEVTDEVINRIPDMSEENAEIEKKTMLVFEKVDDVLVVRANTIRAHLKDCTSQVQNQLVGRIRGERNFTTRIKNGLYVGGGLRDASGTEVLPLLRDNKALTDWDGMAEARVHAKGPTGPINALKQFAYVIKPTIKFTAYLLGESVKPTDLQTILRYGATHGYLGERSMQEGQYKFEIEVPEKLEVA